MKRILFLFAASLLFLACSHDDNGPNEPRTLKIKKFTSIDFKLDAPGTPTGESIEYSFDENGIFIHKKTVENYLDVLYTYFEYYTYNQLGQLTKIYKTYVDYSVDETREYSYDSENRLTHIKRIVVDNPPITLSEMTYQKPNEVRIEHNSGSIDIFVYHNNILSNIGRVFDFGGSEETLSYDANNNIIEIALTDNVGIKNTNRNYSYDDKINPLYPYFNENPYNFFGENNFQVHYCHLFFSPNNSTSEIVTSWHPDNAYTITKTFQYNQEGYPISAVVKKNDVLFKEFTYEYY